MGGLWARVSKGKGLFVWAMKRDVRGQPRTAIEG